VRELAGAAVGAAACLVTSPYLARLTASVPDATDRHWWRGRPVSRRCDIVTGAVGLVLGALAGYAASWSALLPALVALALCASPLVVIDLQQHRLPDRLVLAATVLAALLLALAALVRGDWYPYLRAIAAAAAVLVVLFVLALISPSSFGLGDVKLGAVLGGYLGWFGWSYVYWGIAAGFVLGAVVALVLIAIRRANMKTTMAFGPMLVLGTLLALLARR
jgi:leader peptidase (prepilin peptidase)/N-methyltransferase